MAKGLFESINNSLDNLIKSSTPVEKKEVKAPKKINESVALVEKAVPEEDRYVSDTIKNIVNKRRNRANAKLTPSEQRLADKYGITSEKGRFGNRTKVGQRELNYAPSYKGAEDINYADMARKGIEREKKNKDLGIYTIDRANRFGIPDGSREVKGFNTLTQSRDKHNRDLSKDYRDVAQYSRFKKDAEKDLKNVDADFDKKKAGYIDDISRAAKALANIDYERETARANKQGWVDTFKNSQREIINKHRKNKNESISALRRRRSLVEKAVPEEDRYENDLIKSIINKRSNRSNAKLTSSEQEVANKYGITTGRYHSGIKTRVGNRNIRYVPNGKGYDDINYVDMARKGTDRMSKAYETGINVVNRFSGNGLGGSREEKKSDDLNTRNALVQSRNRLNRVMQNDYSEVASKAGEKKYYKNVLDNVDNEFDKRSDYYIAKINNLTRELADVEKGREEKRTYNKNVINNITNSQKAIIDKHRKNKNESLKKNRKKK